MTIKDIAKAAGVSHGTVSNVLNKKGIVSSEKIRLVEETAQKLGYYRNVQAQSLRKGVSNRLVVLMPLEGMEKYHHFFKTLKSLEPKIQFNIDIVYFSSAQPIEETISKVISELPHTIICMGFSPRNLPENVETEIILVDVYKQNCSGFASVKFNHKSLVDYLNELVKQKKMKTMVYLSSLPQIYDTLFDSIQLDCQSVYLETDIENILSVYPEIQNMTKDDLIITSHSGISRAVHEMYAWLGIKYKPTIINLNSTFNIYPPEEIQWNLDYAELASQVIQSLKDFNNHREILVEMNKPEVPNLDSKAKSNTHIRLLTVDSPFTQILKILCQRYFSITGVRVEISEYEYDRMNIELTSHGDAFKNYDIVRFDMAWLNKVREDIFIDWSDLVEYKRLVSNLIPGISKEYFGNRNKDTFIPFDIGVQLLFYRRDIFIDPLVKREFRESFKKDLEVPHTFQDYDLVSNFFKQYLYNDKLYFAHSKMKGGPLLMASDFLPRYREIKLNKQVQALESSVESYLLSRETALPKSAKWWPEAFENLENDRTIMEIIYSNHFRLTDKVKTGKIGFSQVPGGQSLIGGGSVGILASSNEVQASIEFLLWLYSPEVSKIIADLGGLLPTRNVMTSTSIKIKYPWIQKIPDALKKGSRMQWNGEYFDIDNEIALGEMLLKRV